MKLLHEHCINLSTPLGLAGTYIVFFTTTGRYDSLSTRQSTVELEPVDTLGVIQDVCGTREPISGICPVPSIVKAL